MQEIIASLKANQKVDHINAYQHYPSCFQVSNLAAASIGAVGSAMAQLVVDLGLAKLPPAVTVNQRLASLWFGWSIKPIDWEMPPVWDAIAGDYQTRDGWIKLHTNLPHHRQAALRVLGTKADRDIVSDTVKDWDAEALEQAIVNEGGVAAAMRSEEDWSSHAQGRAVKSEPLIAWQAQRVAPIREWEPARSTPLKGLRVLDLTRVLAGPVATRTLAAFGADILRIDPPGWDEANVVPDITLGKKCATLRLDTPHGREIFEQLLSCTDVLVHGYRSDALERLGLGEKHRRDIAPGLIDVSLNAYGWSGPWAKRRGFDSLVQMSSGIADSGAKWSGKTTPTPLPVQALDHATGYLMAAATLQALSKAITDKQGSSARLSLARTAEALKEHRQDEPGTLDKTPLEDDFSKTIEKTAWGPAHRLQPPLSIDQTPMHWTKPACDLGSSPPEWAGRAKP